MNEIARQMEVYNKTRHTVTNELEKINPIKHAASLYKRGFRTWVHGKSWFQVSKFGERLYVPEQSYRLLKAMEMGNVK
jgi:hypothetical protein